MQEKKDQLIVDLKELERSNAWQKLKKRNKRLLWLLLLETIVSLGLILYAQMKVMHYDEFSFNHVDLAYLLSIPMVGTVLGFVFSFIPYRKLPFWKKYWHATLWVMIIYNPTAMALLLVLKRQGFSFNT